MRYDINDNSDKEKEGQTWRNRQRIRENIRERGVKKDKRLKKKERETIGSYLMKKGKYFYIFF